MARLRFRPRYADVAATLALVVATAGTSYAAVVVTSADIKDNTVQSRDVRDGTLKLIDINDTAEATLRGRTGPQGPQGIQGLKGDTGDQGIQGIPGLKGDTGDQGIQGIQGIQGLPGTDGTNGTNGVSGLEAAHVTESGPASGSLTAEAVCPAGKKVIGGGFSSNTGSMIVEVTGSQPMTYPGGGVFPEYPDGAEVWHVTGRIGNLNGNLGTTTWYLDAWAMCATAN